MESERRAWRDSRTDSGTDAGLCHATPYCVRSTLLAVVLDMTRRPDSLAKWALARRSQN